MRRFLAPFAAAALFLVPIQAHISYAADVKATAAVSVSAKAPSAATAAASDVPLTKPDANIGQPRQDTLALQEQVTDDGIAVSNSYNYLFLPITIGIAVFVGLLLLYVILRFNRRANPVPSKTSHNTMIEIIWTAIPTLILAGLFLLSFKQLRTQFTDMGEEAITIKATGHQWYWTYKYPDNGDFEVMANMLSDDQAKAAGLPRLLETNHRLIIPVNTPIRLQTTSSDVIHSWSLPAFWAKIDAAPGKLNQLNLKVNKEGVYYGQCAELCGINHGFMPIAVEVVSKEKYHQWILAQGGHDKGAVPAAAPANAAAPAAASADNGSTAAPAANSAAPAVAKN
jgi:cytochrome c oxidase subunit II